MKPVVSCEINDDIATITLDDGKSNAITPAMVEQLNKALDQAAENSSVVILTGRSGVFSSGFDLKVMKSNPKNIYKMIIGSFRLARRLLGFPCPVIIACNGHAMAMGSFLLLTADYRVGIDGDYKIVANEVALGMTMPYTPIELCRARLKPAHFDRAVLLSEQYTPQAAVDAGFFDTVVSEKDLGSVAMEKARQCVSLDTQAHRESKLRMRRELLNTIKHTIRRDIAAFLLVGVKQAIKR